MKMCSKAALFPKNKWGLQPCLQPVEQHLKGQPEKTRKAAVNRKTLHLTNLFSHFRSQKLERYLQISVLLCTIYRHFKRKKKFIHHFAYSVLLCILCIRLAYINLLRTVALHTAVTVEEKNQEYKNFKAQECKDFYFNQNLYSQRPKLILLVVKP